LPPATNAIAEELPLIPEDARLIEESMLWDYTVSVRTGAGYNDNVLLSPSSPHGSALLTGGLDCSISRLPLAGWGLDFVASGDDVRYLQNGPSDGTDFWLADLTLKHLLGDNWLAGVEGLENYLDEVDYVDGPEGPEIVELQGNNLKLKPFVRRNFGTNWWVKLDLPATREILNTPLDDTWKFGPQLLAEYSDGARREISLSGQFQRITHDTWPALEADGTPLARTLALNEERVELTWREFWGSANRWSTETKFSYVRDDDNGGGFFNLDEYSASERVRFHAGNWEIATTVRGSYLDYPVQRIGFVTGSRLNEVLLHATVHGEYRLTRWLKLYAEYNHDQVLSDLPDIRYAADTVVTGLIWEF
jgi:hypothetical protein